MAKGKKAASTDKAAKRKVNAEKYETANDFYETINESKVGKDTITTQACTIRNVGVLVREISSNGTVSASTFIPGVKVKRKKAWLTLVQMDSEEKKAEKAEKRKAAKAGKGKKK